MHKIYIEITTKCGLNCSFCPPHRQNSTMDLELFDKCTKEAKTLTNEVALHIMGDPLMVENLTSYLDICQKHQLKTHIVTSGFYTENLQTIADHPSIKQINFSLNSFNANSTKKSLDDYLLPLISLAKYASDQGRIFVNFRLWNLDEDGTSKNFNDQLISILDQHFTLDRERSHIQLAPKVRVVFDRLFAWADLDAPFVADQGFCFGATKQLGILASGAVVPCCIDHKGIITLGDISKNSLKEILKSPRSEALISGFKEGKIAENLCQHCGYRTRFD